MGANTTLTGTGKAGSFGRATGNSVRLRPEIDERIAQVEPESTPTLTVLNKLMKAGGMETIRNPEFQVQEEWPLNDVLQGTATETSSSTTLDVTDATLAIPAMVIQNTRTKEQMYITAIASATTLTILRAFGTVGAQACLATDRYSITGTATEEGQDAIQNRMRATGSHLNYAQKIAHKMSVTDIMLLHGVYGPMERERLSKQGLVEFKKLWNKTFLLGQPNKNTTAGTHAIYTTGGIRYWAQLYNYIDMGGAFTYNTLADAMSMRGIRYGGQGEKFAVCSQRLWVQISRLLRTSGLTVNVNQNEDTIGGVINRIKFPGGTLNLMVDYSLEEAGFDDELIVFDLRYLSICNYEGQETEEDIQTPGAYRKEWQIFARRGLKQRLPVSSSILGNMQYAA